MSYVCFHLWVNTLIYLKKNRNNLKSTFICSMYKVHSKRCLSIFSNNIENIFDFALKPLRDDSALTALLSLRGLRGAPAVPPLCRETQSLGQQMLNATVGINGLAYSGNGSWKPTRKSREKCVQTNIVKK